jgi:hypothetical protein
MSKLKLRHASWMGTGVSRNMVAVREEHAVALKVTTIMHESAGPALLMEERCIFAWVESEMGGRRGCCAYAHIMSC